MRNKFRPIGLALVTLVGMFVVLTATGCGQDAEAVSKDIPADKSNVPGKKNLGYLSPE